MTDKAEKKRKRWWLPAAVLLAIAVVVGVGIGIYFYLQPPDRTKMTAEETLALYMECWQKKDYEGMMAIWYPSIREEIHSSNQVSSLSKTNVTGVVDIERARVGAKYDASRYAPYDQAGLYVTYQTGGSGEETEGYILIQLQKGGPWYIVDHGFL